MNTAEIIEKYYQAMRDKQFEVMEKFLHPNVQFSAPLAKVQGKEAVLENNKKFASFFKALSVRAAFGSKDQAIVVYDVTFPGAIGNVPTTAFMTFENGLIRKIELFYDARPFEKNSVT